MNRVVQTVRNLTNWSVANPQPLTWNSANPDQNVPTQGTSTYNAAGNLVQSVSPGRTANPMCHDACASGEHQVNGRALGARPEIDYVHVAPDPTLKWHRVVAGTVIGTIVPAEEDSARMWTETGQLLAHLHFLGLLAVGILGLQACSQAQTGPRISLQATEGAEQRLTESHGVEASAAINNFLANWLSFESFQDPSIQGRLVTQQYLDYVGLGSRRADLLRAPSLLVTKSIALTGVRVLEYTSQEFRVIGCGIEYLEDVTPAGAPLATVPPYSFRSIFVFVRENDTWKLAANFALEDPDAAMREWDVAPDWLRQLVGDMPSYLNDTCIAVP